MRSFRCWVLAALLPAVLHTIPAAMAAPARLIVEDKTPQIGGLNLLMYTYASLPDLLSNTIADLRVLPLGDSLSTNFDLAGFAADGNGFRLIVEPKAPQPGLNLVMYSYASLAGLLSNTIADLRVLPLGDTLSTNFDLVGFAKEGDGYRLVVEPKTPQPGLNLVMYTYASLADLLSNTIAELQVLPLGDSLSTDFDVAGFSADGDGYRLIVERKTPVLGGLNLVMYSYASLTDLLNNTIADLRVLPLGDTLSPDFDLHGFDIPAADPRAVPEPVPLALLLAGLAGHVIARRRTPILRGERHLVH